MIMVAVVFDFCGVFYGNYGPWGIWTRKILARVGIIIVPLAMTLFGDSSAHDLFGESR